VHIISSLTTVGVEYFVALIAVHPNRLEWDELLASQGSGSWLSYTWVFLLGALFALGCMMIIFLQLLFLSFYFLLA
jgi:hypothetical protein